MNPISVLAAVALATQPLVGQLTVSLSASADATIYSEDDGANGSFTRFYVGATSGGNTRRGLVRFDLSAVPAGAVVQSVEIDLTPTFSNVNNRTFSLHRITETWTEGPTSSTGVGLFPRPLDVTWNFASFPTTSWSVPGGAFVGAPSGSRVFANFGTQTILSTPALVADVQGFVDGTFVNGGWIVRGDEVDFGGAYRFASRESFGGDGPVLRVTYDVPGSTETFGTPCGGLALGAFGGVPTVGNASFGLALTNAPTDFAGGTLLLSGARLQPAFVFLGCPLWVDPGLVFASVAVSGSGNLPLALPADPGIVGLRFVIQGVGVLTSTFALDTSNGLEVLVGS